MVEPLSKKSEAVFLCGLVVHIRAGLSQLFSNFVGGFTGLEASAVVFVLYAGHPNFISSSSVSLFLNFALRFLFPPDSIATLPLAIP